MNLSNTPWSNKEGRRERGREGGRGAREGRVAGQGGREGRLLNSAKSFEGVVSYWSSGIGMRHTVTPKSGDVELQIAPRLAVASMASIARDELGR